MSRISHSGRCGDGLFECYSRQRDPNCPACRLFDAAPQLLEACKDAMLVIEQLIDEYHLGWPENFGYSLEASRQIHKSAMAAIAEAEPKGGYIEAIPETAAGHDKLREINTKLLEACKVAEESLLIYFETLKRNCAVSSLSKDDFEKISFAHHTINTVLAEAEPTKEVQNGKD